MLGGFCTYDSDRTGQKFQNELPVQKSILTEFAVY